MLICYKSELKLKLSPTETSKNKNLKSYAVQLISFPL
ncbi:hypothetical protein BANRA_01633 [Acinetobacter baumannii]|nr:hypothetical protein BANRA_01633 [Acinetobacter baumannii]